MREGWLSLKRMPPTGDLAGIDATEVARQRRGLGVHPVYKRIDTCAAEFASSTPYMYSCYEGLLEEAGECEAEPSDRRKVIILGGGPNRIGQGIEFDYCCVHAAYALRDSGIETIMVNCNPETVSTDYDTSDRLYFEPLTAEDVIEIARVEARRGKLLGVIVQFGGQTPLKLAAALEANAIPILGTSPDAIDLAEDRERFQKLLSQLGLRQPANGVARSIAEAEEVASRIGYPLVIRPSYVLRLRRSCTSLRRFGADDQRGRVRRQSGLIDPVRRMRSRSMSLPCLMERRRMSPGPWST
jgi:carbamoyl-phosphate synthase large subunit